MRNLFKKFSQEKNKMYSSSTSSHHSSHGAKPVLTQDLDSTRIRLLRDPPQGGIILADNVFP